MFTLFHVFKMCVRVGICLFGSLEKLCWKFNFCKRGIWEWRLRCDLSITEKHWGQGADQINLFPCEIEISKESRLLSFHYSCIVSQHYICFGRILMSLCLCGQPYLVCLYNTPNLEVWVYKILQSNVHRFWKTRNS